MKTLAFILVLVPLALAQTFLMERLPVDQSMLSLRFMHPDFEHGDVTFFSGVYELSVSVPVSGSLNLIGCLPYAFYSLAESNEIENSSALCNLCIGIQASRTHYDKTGWGGSVIIALPTAPDAQPEALLTGMLTCYFRGRHRYLSKVLSIVGNFSRITSAAGGAVYGFEIGPDLWIPIGDTYDRASEIFIHYGFMGGIPVSRLMLSAELVGLAHLTGDYREFGDRFEHALCFGGKWRNPTVGIGLFYQVNTGATLDDIVNGVLGFEVDLSI